MQPHRKQHHQDLSAIPESEEIGDDISDDFSLSKSHEEYDHENHLHHGQNSAVVSSSASSVVLHNSPGANSYAFSLNDVGYDEEECGSSSVKNVNAPVTRNDDAKESITTTKNTPPSNKQHSASSSPKRMSEHEKFVYKETCEKFELPYSEDWLHVGSSNNSFCDHSIDVNDSVLGSISISDESVDDSPEWRHDSMINKILSSWHKSSTKTKKKQQQNDESSKESIGSTTTNSIDSTTVTGSLRVKERLSEMWNSSFNQSSVDNAVYESSGCSATTTTDQHTGVVKGCNDNEAAVQMNNQQQNCHGQVKKTSLGNHMDNNFLFFQSRMECLVNTYHESSWKKRLVVSSTILFVILCVLLIAVGQSSKSSATPMSGSDTGNVGSEVVSNIRKRPPKNEDNATTTAGANTTNTNESTSLQGIDDNGGVESCIDNEGRYYSSSGKKRQCAWLAMTSTTTTTTTTTTNEAILGPLYSDLLYTECGASMTELGLNCRYTCRAYNGCLLQLQGEEGVEDGSDKEEASSPIPTFQMNATMELLRSNDDDSDEIISTSVQSQHDTSITELSMYNVNDYTKSLHIWQEELGLIDPTSKLPMEVQKQQKEETMIEDGNKTEMTLLSSPLILTTTPTTCIDNNGYYLNHNGLPRQCSWLINSHDPTDETRRIHNCGYIDSGSNQYSVSTELGKMCKKTCGTCF